MEHSILRSSNERCECLNSPNIRIETLYDIGANIGTICIPAVGRGLVLRAVAFEPEPANFQMLMTNIHLNGLSQLIVPHNLALGANRGEMLRFELSPDNMGDHRVRVRSGLDLYDESSREVIDVPSDTFDALVPQFDAANALIWIDVQGYEGNVFKGAQQAISAGVPIALEVAPYLVERAGCEAALRSTVQRYGTFYDLGEKEPSPHPIADFDALYSSVRGKANVDLLLIRDEVKG